MPLLCCYLVGLNIEGQGVLGKGTMQTVTPEVASSSLVGPATSDTGD
jgi:hypothetical protein